MRSGWVREMCIRDRLEGRRAADVDGGRIGDRASLASSAGFVAVDGRAVRAFDGAARADRHIPGVDALGGKLDAPFDLDVGRREAEGGAFSPPVGDAAGDAVRAREQARGLFYLARCV